MDISFVFNIFEMHFGDYPSDMPRFGVPGHVITDRK